MATPRRRSSRLKSATPSRNFAPFVADKLSSLVERDETPQGSSSINAIIASSTTPTHNRSMMPGAFDLDDSLVKITPQTGGRLYPGLEEMHPSKVHQGTAKKPDSGLQLGFIDADARIISPSKNVTTPVQSDTPTKPPIEKQSTMSSPGFDFKWNRQHTDLSAEAEKIMESVREEAARIKLQMQAERDEQARRDDEAEYLFGVGGRKIAKAKGKEGRFSDAHKQEFKKMDSISNHPSAWKNKFQENRVSLKRSKSKAALDEPEEPFAADEFVRPLGKHQNSDRLENVASGKRVKQNYGDDISSARPTSQDGTSQRQVKIGIPIKHQHALPSVMTTPTKASLARAVTAKSVLASKLPSFSRSKSMKELKSPAMVKSETGKNPLSSLPRVGSMKSILHRSQPKISNDPVKIAAGTHVAAHDLKGVNKDLPSLPVGTSHNTPQSTRTLKRVEFTPTTKATYELAAASPSPSKIPAPNAQRQETVSYPSIIKSGPLNSNPVQPGDFSFRSYKTINVGPATSGLTSPTIRQVRPSGISTPLAVFDNIPTVPHGILNKKRRRLESDDEDLENQPPRTGLDVDSGPKAKKTKKSISSLAKAANLEPSMAEKRLTAAKETQSTKTGEKKKGFLSRARLNMLAKPKNRN